MSVRHRENSKNYYLNHKAEISLQQKGYYKTHCEEKKKCNKEYDENLRMQVLIHYGGNPPKCACCGETIFEFLTIDHINNDGAEHRKQVGRGIVFYRWLKKNNFPEGYQVLCYNCNCAKGHYGICPHKTIKHFDVDEAERIYGIKETPTDCGINVGTA